VTAPHTAGTKYTKEPSIGEKRWPGPPLKTMRSTSATSAPASIGQNQAKGMRRRGSFGGVRSASLLSSSLLCRRRLRAWQSFSPRFRRFVWPMACSSARQAQSARRFAVTMQ
jgi:hypothetical protein